MYKFLQALRSGWGHIPLVKLLMRDGTWAFFLLFCKPYFHLAALFLLIVSPAPSVLIVAQLSLYALSPHAYAGMLYAFVHITFPVIEKKISLYSTHLSSPQLAAHCVLFLCKFFFAVFISSRAHIFNAHIVLGIPHPNQHE